MTVERGSMRLTPANRSFYWESSVEGDTEILKSLHEEMLSFYGEASERADYQDMLDNLKEEPDHETSTTRLARYASQLQPDTLLEVGCGNGRLFRTMSRLGVETRYTGIEVADHVVDQNRSQHPEVRWRVGSAYNLPATNEEVELVCAEFVIEHLVFPRESLEEMIRVVEPGGHLILVFPDFVSAGRLNSQILGYSPARTAFESLKQTGLRDALVSLYDSRVRLPRALSRVHEKVGPFPVNLRPACLTYPGVMFPDVDAVYIASKQEIESWAKRHGYGVKYPMGKDGIFREEAFMAIQKPALK